MNEYAQFCAVARAAEVVGERWTLLIFRELFLGPKRYSDMLDRLQSITPAVLNGRLRKLEHRDLIRRREVGPPTPARLFELTEAGAALRPALFELLRWGSRYLFPRRPGERFETDWLRMVMEAYAAPGPLPPVVLALRIEGEVADEEIVVSGGSEGVTIGPVGETPKARLRADIGALMGIMFGRLALDAAISEGRASVEGDLAAAATLPRLFRQVDG